MGRTVNSNLNALLALGSCNTQTTVDLIPVTGSPIYAATDAFTTGGKTYAANLIRSDQLQQSYGAATNRIRVEIDNVEKLFGVDVADEEFVRAQAILGRFYRNEQTVVSAPNTGEWRELFRGEAVPIEINESVAVLEILHDLTAAGFCVANWSLAENCQSPFKATGLCGYTTGGLTTCNKRRRSPNGCQARDNELRFMGMEFPDAQVPSPPVVVDPPDDNGDWPGDGGIRDRWPIYQV